MISHNPKIGFIGFGEVAYYLSKGLKSSGIKHVLAYARNPHGEVINKRVMETHIELKPTLEQLVKEAEIIISATTGRVALKVAKNASKYLISGKMFVDLNNSTPAMKKSAAEIVNATGAKFVDIALMAAPQAEEHKALIYISGDGAEEFNEIMGKYGMNIRIISGNAGAAMTIKAVWQIDTKVTEAMLWELILTAHKVGIDLSLYEPWVIKTPTGDISFYIPQSLVMHAGLHANRIADELLELAKQMKDWGMEPIVVRAAAKRLKLIARYKLKDHFKAEEPAGGYKEMIQVINKISKQSSLEIN